MPVHAVEPARRAPYLAAALLLLVISVSGLLWAKWWPYSLKLDTLLDDRSWPGASPLDSAGHSGSGPSLRGGWDFAVGYGEAVWKALVVALVVAAAVDALVPRRPLAAALARRRGLGGSLLGGFASMPCMMCTCCAAPIVGTLRRNGASTSSALAYWLGNPTLNPAVLAFLAIVAPWQWFATRLAVGVVLVFAVTVLIDRLAAKRDAPPSGDVPAAPADDGLRAAPRRFVRSLARLSLTLVPEYAVVVFTIGALRGWLFPFEGDATQWGVLAVAAAAVLGTLVVVPTAGEIPILVGLAAAGAGAGVVGALLITLPAISLPSMIMVMRELSWRVTAAAGTAVAVAGLAAGGLLWTLG
ncbi:permease [Actinomadura madurae]|uniref:permease n=1 Tax=Actinomadura madurae TaxID=1993 RepID=UPI000D98531D|nr:permease [Actinomadura madurae]SPT59136.1 Predicted permease [Actinomadura madurae]